MTIGVATSRYHHDITGAMRQDAIQTFEAAGGRRDDLVMIEAPGAFELTAIAQALALRPDVDGVVALGCIVRGETTHDQHLASAIANGLTRITLDTGKPVAFGVLTCQGMRQARDRAGGEKGNKGGEAMTATIEAIRAVRAVAGAGTIAAHGGSA